MIKDLRELVESWRRTANMMDAAADAMEEQTEYSKQSLATMRGRAELYRQCADEVADILNGMNQ